VHIDDVLRSVLGSEGWIDMLKIDTEGLENRTVEAADPDLLAQVGVICFETLEPVNPAPERFELRYATDTARLTNRSGAGVRARPDAGAVSPGSAERTA
jgi:hypothetical protein